MPRLNIDELSEGMIISEDIIDLKTKKLLLKQNTKLNENLINSLKSKGVKNVEIENMYTLSINPYDTTRKEIKQLLTNEIIKIAPDKTEANTVDGMDIVGKRAVNIVNNIISNDTILALCVEMKIQDAEYIYRHCIRSCALSLLVAGAIGLSDEEMELIGKAALLHDIGACEMPQIVRMKDKNSQEEALWREHASYGYYYIMQNNLDSNIARLILHHHEAWDGTGYPNKISKTDIPIGSRIIALCETYDKLIMLDNYPNYQAIEYIYAYSTVLFDQDIVKVFSNHLALYPLGSLVRLSTGDVGTVINVRQNFGNRPIVRVFFNNLNRPYSSPRDIDLGVEKTTFIKEIL